MALPNWSRMFGILERGEHLGWTTALYLVWRVESGELSWQGMAEEIVEKVRMEQAKTFPDTDEGQLLASEVRVLATGLGVALDELYEVTGAEVPEPSQMPRDGNTRVLAA